MTFYRFDYSNFPEVKVSFIKNIEKKYVKTFFDECLTIYNYKKPFYMIYDTSSLYTAPPTFIYKLARFIKKIKKKEEQYLTKSILIATDTIFARCLLNTAMTLTSPAADLYIYWKKENDNAINVNNINMILQRAPALFQCMKANN
jgi:hypothetical protein